ncbi:MAG: transglycosylase SLT domain-containing protein [Gemmatimonadales bacterium]
MRSILTTLALLVAPLQLRAPVAIPLAASVVPPVDSTIRAAREALAAGRPWQASRLLAPLLRDSATRSPEAELVAASAAAAWGGWKEADRILRDAHWLDSEFDGEGHELLARANLGLRRDSLARTHALLAVELAPTPVGRADRLVLLARALDRLKEVDSAAATYLAGADGRPEIADWLRLRAFAVTRDSGLRAQRGNLIVDSTVRARLPLAAAQAFEKTGDTASAIVAYELAGFPLSALRLRAAGADSLAREEIRGALLGTVTERSGSAAARTAVRLIDSLEYPLRPGEQLLVARSLAKAGPFGRAADGYAAALAAGLGDDADRYEYANVLFRLARYADAVRWYRRVAKPSALAASSAYREARSYVRDGRADEGKALLRRLARTWPRDTASASALYLLADLATDDRRDSLARATFRQVTQKHPTSRLASASAFRAAMIAFIDGHPRTAAVELDSLRQRWPTSEEASSSLYWAGRAWADAGDTAAARLRWQGAMAWDSASYYSEASARRLGVAPWQPAPAADVFLAAPDLEATAERAELLERLGMDDEADAERARFTRDAGSAAERLLSAADIMRRRGRPSQTITLARRAQTAGAPKDARLYRLLYPLSFGDAVLAEASRHKLDPSLVAALIRQESLYNPEATSSAGARGLMQVMPDVGKGVAKSLDYDVWDPVLLYQPDVNIELGSAHLRDLLDSQGSVVEVLAAYNAGAHRVARWRTKNGGTDPELLVERIPYVETRDYVRIVQRNRALYRALYPWPDQLTP